MITAVPSKGCVTRGGIALGQGAPSIAHEVCGGVGIAAGAVLAPGVGEGGVGGATLDGTGGVAPGVMA